LGSQQNPHTHQVQTSSTCYIEGDCGSKSPYDFYYMALDQDGKQTPKSDQCSTNMEWQDM